MSALAATDTNNNLVAVQQSALSPKALFPKDNDSWLGKHLSKEELVRRCKLSHDAQVEAMHAMVPKVRADHARSPGNWPVLDHLNRKNTPGDDSLNHNAEDDFVYIREWLTVMSLMVNRVFSEHYVLNNIGEKTIVTKHEYMRQQKQKAIHDYTTNKTIWPILQQLNTVFPKGTRNVAHYLEFKSKHAIDHEIFKRQFTN